LLKAECFPIASQCLVFLFGSIQNNNQLYGIVNNINTKLEEHMIKIDDINCQKVHTRNIHVATYAHASDAIIVEGRLTDNRLVDSYRSGATVIPPGIVHDMLIRLEIKGPRMKIEDLDVQMPTVPHEDCDQTRRSLEPIIGMEIVSGFTLKVKALVGGAKGCAHLVALLTAMASAAVQGAWSAVTREPMDNPDFKHHTLARIKDTCYVWRSDGPALKKYEETLKSAIKK
jgi:hypothetical protein